MSLQIGQRIVVRTPDRRSFAGRLLELRTAGSRPQAMVRLDTGWETTYPLEMVHPEGVAQTTSAQPVGEDEL